jgi:disease resistance protein RPM1
MKKLTSLEVLEGVTLGPKCFAEDLGFITGLRALRVSVYLPEDKQYRQECGEAMAESLGKLQKIESLSIDVTLKDPQFVMDGSVEPPLGNLRRLHIDGYIKTLPTWINGASVPALSYLDVIVWHERREDMQTLGTLPCLRHLTFSVWRRAEQALDRSEVGTDAFPSATSCDFAGYDMACSMVPSVFIGGAMLRLQDYKFNIHLEDFCGSGAPYTVDDLALAHLPSLRSVSVYIVVPDRVNEEVLTSVEEKLKYEVAAHPNRPRLIYKVKRW